MRMLSKLKKIKFWTVLLLLTVVLILLSGEFIARIFVKQNRLPHPPPVSTIDPYGVNPYILPMRPFLFFHIPGSRYIQSRSYYAVKYNINSEGFRGPEIYPKKKGEHRLIIIGDSITEGQGNRFYDTFPCRLNKRAKKYKWQVLNLGVQGASPIYYAANIKRYLSTDPDAAVIVMFENDLYEDRVQEKFYYSKPVLDHPEKLLVKHKYKTDNNIISYLRSKFYDLFKICDRSRLYLLLQRSADKINPTDLEKIINQNLKINIDDKEQEKLNKMSPWLIAPSMFDTQWNMTSKYLEYTISKFKNKKVPVYLIFLSLGNLSPGLDKAYAIHAETFNKKVKTWAKTNKIPFLSLVPVIKKLMKTVPATDIMIKDDGHPTAKLHKIISDHIWKWLLSAQQ